MAFAESWKQIKNKYEASVKEKKPSEKWFGQFRKSSGIESACKELDTAIAKGKRADGEKALASLKKAGEAYLTTLDKIMETESVVLKQIKTKNLRISLDEMLTEAHNAIKGLDNGVFDLVLGPDIMSRALSLKFHKDAFVKSFATGADFTKSYATSTVSPNLVSIQKEFAAKYKICLDAYRIFISNKGKTVQKLQALKVAKVTLDEIFVHAGREGMLGILRMWESQQVKETNNQKEVIARFLKSTQYQVLKAVGDVLNHDAEKLNGAISKAQSIKV
jgi:hypothetical protein